MLPAIQTAQTKRASTEDAQVCQLLKAISAFEALLSLALRAEQV